MSSAPAATTRVSRHAAFVPGTASFEIDRALRRRLLTAFQVGRYVMLERLGSGGTGVVVQAYDARLQREVALKMVAMHQLGTAAGERILRDAHAMAKLAHP